MMLAATFTEVPATSWPNLLTWGGLAVLVMVSIVRGWLVPKSSHEREIEILEKRIVELISEKNEWRAASIADQAVAQETRAQHRLLLETQRSTTYALEQMRSGFEQATAGDVNHD